MCFFYGIPKDKVKVQNHFSAKYDPIADTIQTGEVNGFARPFIPVITDEYPGKILLGQWPLTPEAGFSDPAGYFKKVNTLNARIETVENKPSYKDYTDNRCLILAECFYEWKHETVNGKLFKLKHEITMASGEPFAMAGIYNLMGDVPTCTILTTEANPLMAEIHNTKKRMPVILSPQEERLWLENDRIEPYANRNHIELVAIPLVG